MQLAQSEPNSFIYPLIKTPAREGQFIWIGELLTFNLAFIQLNSNKKMKINTLNDAKNYKIGLVRNDFAHHYLLNKGFKEGDHFELFSNLPQLLKLIYAKKIDTFIADLPLLKITARSLGYNENKIIESYLLKDFSHSVYLAANLKTPAKIVEKIRTSLIYAKDNRNDIYKSEAQNVN